MSVIHVANWAQSANGKPIELYKSAENPQAPIIFMGGVHGDEPEGVALAKATLQWLKSNTHLNLVPWILIPCINPDGFSKNERTNGNGVDLNRNYPSADWTATATQPRYNPGPSAASEPEIKALVQLIAATKPRMIIHCHSWNPCIVYAGEPALASAQALGRASGYKVMDDIGYPTPGSLSRYGWRDNKIPIICIEEQEGAPLDTVWSHFASGIEEIFTKTGHHYG